MSRPPPPALPEHWSDLAVDDDDDTTSQAAGHGGRHVAPSVSATETGSTVVDGDQDYYDGDADDGYGEPEELPEHACRYCRRSDPLGAVKCGTCKKWFCNSRAGTSGSHIIQHMVKCKHKEVQLHPDGPMGDATIECYVCGCRNLFMLGFLPSSEESTVVILCREPCLNSTVLQDLSWDPSAWLPLIEERRLLPWLASSDAGEGRPDSRLVRPVTGKEIDALENLWRTQPEADLDNVFLQDCVDDLLPVVPLNFPRSDIYRDIFQQHVDAERVAAKAEAETLVFEKISIKWAVGQRMVAKFSVNLGDQKDFVKGEELEITHDGASFRGLGVVLSATQSQTLGTDVVCEMRSFADPNGVMHGAERDGYMVKVLWRDVVFVRMRTALRAFDMDEHSLSAYLYARILGQRPDTGGVQPALDIEDLNAPNLAALNPSQRIAVDGALRQSLALIQGPPGTGKTTVSATIVYHLATAHQSQVLVSASSNIACDQLAERLESTGLNVVRVVARARESMMSSVEHLSLHTLVRKTVEASDRFRDLRRLFQLKEAVGHLSDKDNNTMLRLSGEVEAMILEEADVVCVTCSAAGDKRLSKYRFKYVLVDECTHSTEPESLIPLVCGAKQVILVGDHCQMRPVVTLAPPLAAKGLTRSLFERLVMLGEKPYRLEIQYRMHPCLAEFSSNQFYEGALQNGVAAEARDSSAVFPWPNPRKPMLLYNSIAPEEVGAGGTSYLNRAEAAFVEKCVTRLLMAEGVTPDQIGVITPYQAQRMYIVNYMMRNATLPLEAYQRVEVDSVDAFQGREKEYIILSCVRSNDQQGIGFVADWRRLNVALTRARSGVIIVGNVRALARNRLWHALVTHFKQQKLVVQGSVDGGFEALNIALPKPRELSEFVVQEAQQGTFYMPAFIAGAVAHANAMSGTTLLPLPAPQPQYLSYEAISSAASTAQPPSMLDADSYLARAMSGGGDGHGGRGGRGGGMGRGRGAGLGLAPPATAPYVPGATHVTYHHLHYDSVSQSSRTTGTTMSRPQ